MATDALVIKEPIVIKGKNRLYASYMGYVAHGGIFLPNYLDPAMGDTVEGYLKYIDEDGLEEEIPVRGKVVWKTPVGAQGGRTPGVGIQFLRVEGQNRNVAKNTIERWLGETLQSGESSYTM